MGKLELVTASNGQKFLIGIDKYPESIYVDYLCFDKNKKEWIDLANCGEDIVFTLNDRKDFRLCSNSSIDKSYPNYTYWVAKEICPNGNEELDSLFSKLSEDDAIARLKYLRNLHKECCSLDEDSVIIDYGDRFCKINRFTPMYEDDDFIYKIAIWVKESTNNGVGYEGTVTDIYNAISMCENVDIDDVKQFAKELNCEPKEGDGEDVIANDTESILYYRDGKFELKWLGDDEDEQ